MGARGDSTPDKIVHVALPNACAEDTPANRREVLFAEQRLRVTHCHRRLQVDDVRVQTAGVREVRQGLADQSGTGDLSSS
jgi:hypothetical protein